MCLQGLLIFCCNLKNEQENDQKCWRVPKFKAKRSFLVNFHTKRPNLDPLTEFFENPCSFFVVFYQAEHKNDKDNQHKRWQVPKFKAKQRFGLNFRTKRQNLSQMSSNSSVWPSFLWTVTAGTKTFFFCV